MTSAWRVSLRSLVLAAVLAATATPVARAENDEPHRTALEAAGDRDLARRRSAGPRRALSEDRRPRSRRPVSAVSRPHGVVAEQNITVTPSVTAVAHIAIATAPRLSHNDIPRNTFHPVAATIGTSLSGFAAPIGGYQLNPLGPAPAPTAEPLWVQLRRAGKKVVTATWPGSDGADISISNTPSCTRRSTRGPGRDTDSITTPVPFGPSAGWGPQGFAPSPRRASWPPMRAVTDQLAAAGLLAQPGQGDRQRRSRRCSAPRRRPATCGTSNASGRTLRYDIKAAALDTTDDGIVNYDTLVFFEATAGIPPGPFALPSTGPAYAKLGGPSAKFFFEGSGNKVGAAYFVSFLAPDLATVRFARYGANFIPRNAPVIAVVDDVNNNVGFWAPQPDFRIPERISPGFTAFPDLELEAMYHDQVTTFDRLSDQRRPARDPREPRCGSGHDLLRAAGRLRPSVHAHRSAAGRRTRPTTPASGLPGTRPERPARTRPRSSATRDYLKFAYQQANGAVEAILNESARTATAIRGVTSSSCRTTAWRPSTPRSACAICWRTPASNVNLIGIRTTGPGRQHLREPPGPRGRRRGEQRPTTRPWSAQVAAALRSGARILTRSITRTRAPLFSDVLDPARPPAASRASAPTATSGRTRATWSR